MLVKDGKPTATIVVAKAALKPAKDDPAAQKIAAAADDLQEYVRKMSGAELPIVGDDAPPPGGVGGLIGRSAAADALDADIPSGLTPARREEGFVLLAKATGCCWPATTPGPTTAPSTPSPNCWSGSACGGSCRASSARSCREAPRWKWPI